MKRLLDLVLVLMIVCTIPFSLVACGQQRAGNDDDTPTAAAQAVDTEFKTLGDVFSKNTQNMMSTYNDSRYVCAFDLDGTWWIVEANLEDGMSDKIDKEWVSDQDKVEEMLSPLAVTRADALDTPNPQELDEFVGKNGADLMTEGFSLVPGSVVINGNETDCVAIRESFDYLVTFDGTVVSEDDEFPVTELSNMTVKAIELQGVTLSELESE